MIMLTLVTGAEAAAPTGLTTEYQSNPIGIDAAQPELSWLLTSTQRGERQTAYQILVASSPELLTKNRGDLWNSGKVPSAQTRGIPYAGAALKSQERCWWKVKVWSREAAPSAWSAEALWTMGLLKPVDWSAKWITASKWFMPIKFRPQGLEVGTAGWADVDLGEARLIDSIKLYPTTAASFPLRFQVLGADDPQFTHPRVLVDQTAQDYHASGLGPQEFSGGAARARFVRLQIMVSPSGGSVVRQMEVLSQGQNVALMQPTKEHGTAWNRGHSPFLVDGMPNHGEDDTCPPDACPTTAAPLLRKSFSLTRPVKRATLSIAALGMADVTVNGKKVGDEVLGPPFSDCTKRVFYVTHDITAVLAPGENVLGATLGNGYFSTPGLGFGQRQGGNGPPRLLAQVSIEFADGTRETIATDDSWKWSRGEITFNDLWDGYAEDRRLAKPGWDTPGYADADWRQVSLATPPTGKLCAPMGPPVRVLGAYKPARVEGNHAYFDFLTAGWPRVTVNGKAGQTITIRGHEQPDMTFILAKDGPTILEPQFVVSAEPRDIEVDGLIEPLTPDAVSIQEVRADLKPTGQFTCSNAYFNTIYQALLQTHRNYNLDVPADPTREKQGWTQDAQNMFNTAAYLTNVSGLYRKWWWDMADNQDSDGYIGSVVPVTGRQVYDWNSPWWSGASVFLPWEHYKYYGDRRILAEAYEPMRRYVDFLGKMAQAGIGKNWDDYAYFGVDQDSEAAQERMLVWNGAGDWANPTVKDHFVVPAPMTTMPAWYYYTTIVSQTAALLGKPADAAHYAALAGDIKARFNAKYFHPETGLYGDQADNQTAQILPLAVGLVPEDKRDLAYERLVDAIHARHDHVGVGFVALPFLLQILTEKRETALANTMVNQKDFPSWNTLMHDGILGEGWHGGGAQMPSTGGAIGMWLYQCVLGIRPDPAGPGFTKFILAPQPDPASGLTSASGYYASAQGRIGSDWQWAAGRFTLRASIPANAVATVYIPATDNYSVTESGRPATTTPGIKFLRTEKAVSVYEVGSGEYRFSAVYHPPIPAARLGQEAAP